MARIFIMLMSFGVNAEVNFEGFERLDAKLNCIINNGGVHSKHAKEVCVGGKSAVSSHSRNSQVIKSHSRSKGARKVSGTRVIAVDSQSGQEVVIIEKTHKPKHARLVNNRRSVGSAGGQKIERWTRVGANPEYENFNKFSKQAKAMAIVDFGLHIQMRMKQMNIDPVENEHVFHPLNYRKLNQYGLITEGDKGEQRTLDMRLRDSGKMRLLNEDNGIRPGDKLLFLTEKNKVRSNVVADVSHLDGYIYTLADGRELLDVLDCGNLAVREGNPVKTPETTGPPVPTTETAGETPISKPIVEENVLDDWELFVSIGGSVGGNVTAGAGSLSGAYFPYRKDTKDGRWEVGPGIQAGAWTGETSGFDYEGYLGVIGPAVKYIDWDGWDIEGRVQAGWISKEGRIAEYESWQEGVIMGPSVGYSNYSRELAGEKWFPEFGLYGSTFFPMDFNGDHSWQGKPIADKSPLEFNYLLNVGYRQILYKNDEWGIRFFGQIGYFEEAPTGRSASARLGISDTKKRFFAGCGPNFDLMNNWAVLPGCDISMDIAATVNQSLVESNMEGMQAAFTKNGSIENNNSPR